MELVYIKDLIKDISAADGKSYEEFVTDKGISVEEFEAMLAKGMQMDVGEFEFICNMTGMSQNAIVNYCNAKSALKRVEQAKEIRDEAEGLDPKSKAIFNRYMELLASDIISGDIDVDNASVENIANKYKAIIEKEIHIV